MAQRPGLYITFQSAASIQLSKGTKGVVAIPVKNYAGTAVPQTIYSISGVEDAVTLFGADNVKSINRIFKGGAKTVLAYTLEAVDGVDVTEEEAYAAALAALETYDFDVFVFDGLVTDAIQDASRDWVKVKRDEGKHFFVLTGGSAADDADVAVGNARTERLNDDYVINLISGGQLNLDNDKDLVDSANLSAYIAGVVASSTLASSLTYKELPLVSKTTKRYRTSEIEAGLDAGSLMIFNDVDVVRIVSGVTTSTKKIRAVYSRQAISTDIRKTANSQFIGKMNNTVDSRKALISSIKSYLETLEANNVLTDIVVAEDTANLSTGDTVNLIVSYVEIDSMEKINLGIRI